MNLDIILECRMILAQVTVEMDHPVQAHAPEQESWATSMTGIARINNGQPAQSLISQIIIPPKDGEPTAV